MANPSATLHDAVGGVDGLVQATQDLPGRPLFITVSGAHLYGFPSPDSDVDLRGAMLLPLPAVVGLGRPQETHSLMAEIDGREVDLVVHDAAKFFRLLLKRNGYVLEQVFSPLVVHGGQELERLRRVARGCITRHHVHHYAGFARAQIERFQQEQPARVKTLLYIFRVLLTGRYLLETGAVEANLPRLNAAYRLPLIDDLIAQKRAAEAAPLQDPDPQRTMRLIRDCQARLEDAFAASTLPEAPTSRRELNDLLIELRLAPTRAGAGADRAP